MTDSDSDRYFELCAEVIRRTLTKPLTDDEALLWIALLRTHQVEWQPDVMPSAPGHTSWHGLTLRGAASVIVGFWPKNDERSNETYWYHRCVIEADWQDLNDMPQGVGDQIGVLRLRMEQDPRIVAVTPDSS